MGYESCVSVAADPPAPSEPASGTGDAPAAAPPPASDAPALAIASPPGKESTPPRWPAAALAARRRGFRALTRLLAARLRRVRAARLGRYAAIGVGVVAAGLALALRSTDGPAAAVEGFVVGTCRWSAWIGAGSIALSAANLRAVTDRRDGLEILAFSQGVSPRTLAAARLLATSTEATRSILVPTLIVGVAALASSGSGRVALVRVWLLFFAAIFAASSGLVLGALSTLADRLRPAGGRGLLVAVVLAPWAALDLVGRGVYSVPGALGALLSVGLEWLGLGRLA